MEEIGFAQLRREVDLPDSPDSTVRRSYPLFTVSSSSSSPGTTSYKISKRVSRKSTTSTSAKRKSRLASYLVLPPHTKRLLTSLFQEPPAPPVLPTGSHGRRALPTGSGMGRGRGNLVAPVPQPPPQMRFGRARGSIGVRTILAPRRPQYARPGDRYRPAVPPEVPLPPVGPLLQRRVFALS